MQRNGIEREGEDGIAGKLSSDTYELAMLQSSVTALIFTFAPATFRSTLKSWPIRDVKLRQTLFRN
jgi:hypothetical protein